MRFLWANTDNILHKIVLIQCYTGTRSNELQKMLIKNANLTKQYMISGSKTEAGKNRIIPIADCMLPFIKEFYRESMFKKSKYLFTPEKGIPSIRGTLDFLEIYKKLRLKNRHLSHDARHIFITLSSYRRYNCKTHCRSCTIRYNKRSLHTQEKRAVIKCGQFFTTREINDILSG